MTENEIKNENGVTDIYNNDKLIKIFENQRINLNKDIIFLKEEILQDFKRIETNLNTKYEKQSSNTINKIFKFESVIETMKTKIEDLSEMIFIDKNIQQKVFQLTEFKRRTEDKIIKHEATIKYNTSELKEAINKYDRILTESVIYPGIIGTNSRFKDFHDMIDYILSRISEFNIFKDKNTIDFDEYTLKMDNLYKSIKSDKDSIISTCNIYCAKQIGEYDTWLKKKINSIETNMIEIQKEISEIKINFEEKIKSLNDTMKKINKITDDGYLKIGKEIKENKNENNKKLEIYNNDLNSIKKKLKTIYYKIKKDNSSSNQNSRMNLKKSQSGGGSNFKKYIEGEVSYNKIENPQGKKKIWKKITEKSTKKRRNTFGPEELEDDLNDNFFKKSSGLMNVNSDKESIKKSKKDYDDFSYSSFDKSENEKSRNNKERRNVNSNKNGLRIPNLLNYEEYKTNDIYGTKKRVFQLLNKNKNLNNGKIPIFTKLKSIGDSDNMFNYNYRKRNIRKSKSSFDFDEKINNTNNNKNNYYSIFDNYKDIKIKNKRNKLNVIEVNFDSKFQEDKEKDDLKNLIRKIKENKIFTSERKNQSNKKNKIIKLTKSNIITSDYNLFNKNKLIKVATNNLKSYENKNNFNSTKNSFNNQRLYSSKFI